MDGFLAARERNYKALSKVLAAAPGVGQLQSTQGRFLSSYYCLSIILDGPLASKRADFIARLNAEGIGTSVYYPQPVPRMTYYRDKYGWQDGAFPVAARNQRLLDCFAGGAASGCRRHELYRHPCSARRQDGRLISGLVRKSPHSAALTCSS